MKSKALALLMAFVMCATLLMGCSEKGDTPVSKPASTPNSQSQADKNDKKDDTTKLVVTQSGKITPDKGVKEVIIEADGVILENASLDKVTVSEKLGEGTATLDKVTVKDLYIQGGGKNSVHLLQSTISSIESNRKGGAVHIVVDEKSEVNSLMIASSTLLDVAGKVKTLIAADTAADSKIDIQPTATVADVSIKAKLSLALQSAIENLSLSGEAKGAVVDIAKGITIDTVATNVVAEFKGEGAIKTVITDNKANITGTVKAGKTVISENPVMGNKPNVEAPVTTPTKPTVKPAPAPTPKPDKPVTPPVTPETPVTPPTPAVPKVNVTGVTIESDTTFKMTFSKAIDKVAAAKIENYRVNTNVSTPIAVSAAVVAADGLSVTLTVSSTNGIKVNQAAIIYVGNVAAADGTAMGVNRVEIVLPYTQVLTTIEIGGGVTTVVLPASGTIDTPAFTTVAKDANGDIMATAPVITWSITPAVTGVSIANGVATIDTATIITSKSFVVKATSGSVSATKTVNIISGSELDDALAAINTAADAAATKTALETSANQIAFSLDMTKYNTLDSAGKLTVATAVYTGKPVSTGYGNPAALKTAFDNAVNAAIKEKDDATIAAAKTAIEAATFAPMLQSDVTNQGDVTGKILDVIRTATTGMVVSTSMQNVTYTPAIAGTKATPAGTNGTYNFVLNITSGTGTPVNTKQITQVITATPYTKSNVATLSALSTTVGTLAPVFAESTTAYNITTPRTATTVTVNYTKSNADATVALTADKGSVKGNVVTLDAGEKTVITLRVTAEDGTSTKVYTITATKAEKEAVTNVKANDKTVAYEGTTITTAECFTLDANAGAATYTLTSGTGTGTGTIDATTGDVTVTKAGTFTIGVTTAETDSHKAGANVEATLTVNAGAAPAAPTATSEYGYYLNETRIEGLSLGTTIYEYVLNTSNAAVTGWTSVQETAIDPGKDTVLITDAANTYIHIRVKATDLYSAGAEQILALEKTATITNLDLKDNITAPEAGAAPQTVFVEDDQYTGTIEWKTNSNSEPFTGEAFAVSTVYKAVVTLTPKTGFTATGVTENSFTHTGATTVTNSVDNNRVTIVFPATEAAILKDQATLVLTGATNAIYSATTQQLATTGGSGNGAVTYTVVSGNATVDSSSGVLTLTGAGTVVLKANRAAEGEYRAAESAPVTITISPATLTVIGTTVTDREYDGTANVTLTGGTLEGVINSDTVALATPTGTVPSKDVAYADGTTVTTQAVTTAYTLTGAKAENYTLTQPTNVTAKITPKTLTITPTEATKVYGEVDPKFAGTFSGAVAGETPIYTVDFARAVGEDVGIYAITIGDVTLSDSDTCIAKNYTLLLDSTSVNLSITAKPLTVTGTTVTDRAYDGTNVVALTGGTLEGVIEADASNVTLATPTGTVLTKKVDYNEDGTDVIAKAVTTAYTLEGTQAANYTLTQPIDVTAKITPLELTFTPDVITKVEDTTTTATVTGTLTGAVSGEDVSVDTVTATYASADVGTGIVVTISEITLKGADSANYTVTMPTGVTGTITAKPVIPAVATATGAVTTAGKAAVAATPEVMGVYTAQITANAVADDTITIAGTTLTAVGADALVGTSFVPGDDIAGTVTNIVAALAGNMPAGYTVTGTTDTLTLTQTTASATAPTVTVGEGNTIVVGTVTTTTAGVVGVPAVEAVIGKATITISDVTASSNEPWIISSSGGTIVIPKTNIAFADSDTAEALAVKIRTGLNTTTNLGDTYTITASGAVVTIEQKTAADSDMSLGTISFARFVPKA